MKDSGVEWIGMIPKEWNIHRLKSCVSDRESGAWGNDIAGDEGDVVCLRIADFDYRRYRFKELDNPVRRNYDNSTINRLALKKGDLLVEKSGGGDKTPVGRMVMFDKDYTALYANFMDRLRCQNFVNPNWFLYLWNTFYANGYVWNYIKQTTGLQNYDITSMLTEEKLALPSLPEQQRIASFLDCKCAAIDDVLAKTQESIEEYKKLKQAVITEAVTKGVRGNRPMMSSNSLWFNQIPDTWQIRKVLSFLEIRVVDGPHESPELQEDGIPYISATAVENGQISFENMRGYITPEYCDVCDKRYKPKRNDILMIKLGATTGQVAIVDTDRRFNIWVPLAAIRCNSHVSHKYIYYVFQSTNLLRQMELSWTFGTQQTLGLKTIEQLKVTLPPLDEQREIADYLDKKCAAIDTLIEKKQQFIEELTAYKKSLIYEYVTGKKEVPA